MKEDNKVDWKLLLFIFVYAVVIVFVLATLSGCRTIYVPTPEYHEVHDTIVKKEVVEKEVVKEVTVRDSVSFLVKGDTVYLYKYRYERDYRYEKALQAKIDSLSHIQRDSIPYPVPVEVEVPAKISNWQAFLITLGKGTLIVGMLFLLFLLIKKKLRL